MYEEDEDFPKDEEDIPQIHSIYPIVLLALEKNVDISRACSINISKLNLVFKKPWVAVLASFHS